MTDIDIAIAVDVAGVLIALGALVTAAVSRRQLRRDQSAAVDRIRALERLSRPQR